MGPPRLTYSVLVLITDLFALCFTVSLGPVPVGDRTDTPRHHYLEILRPRSDTTVAHLLLPSLPGRDSTFFVPNVSLHPVLSHTSRHHPLLDTYSRHLHRHQPTCGQLFPQDPLRSPGTSARRGKAYFCETTLHSEPLVLSYKRSRV